MVRKIDVPPSLMNKCTCIDHGLCNPFFGELNGMLLLTGIPSSRYKCQLYKGWTIRKVMGGDGGLGGGGTLNSLKSVFSVFNVRMYFQCRS